MDVVIGIVILIFLVIGLGCAILSDEDEHDDDNFPHNGLGVLDDDEALSLWEMSQL